ncbi:PREDICTED: cyclin-U4-1-like isoform X1 [Ipomoea nil]|uniref:cyclin-U4-1-like isoform X1 n=1 Tax=Ipomoea nil TaxID=35883 RepID=UPI000900C872|nr:PREDICTED: cyclin-U4-1-like isoform X1 [Ipomoea nil]
MAELAVVMPELISEMGSVLQRTAAANDLNSPGRLQKMSSVFHGLTRPAISVESYLERIFKYANCSHSCFVVAYIYLHRFSRRQPLLRINSFNVHRLLIASVLVSVKFMDDLFYNNAYYAKVGGIGTKEMNILEVDFLFGIGFNLNVTPSTFHTYCSHFIAQIQAQRPHYPGFLQQLGEVVSNHHHQCCIEEDDECIDHHHQQHHYPMLAAAIYSAN